MRTHMRYPRIAGGVDLAPKGEGIGRVDDRTPKWWNMRRLLSMLSPQNHTE